MENIVLDKSGILREGYFYEIFVRDDEDYVSDEKDRDSWIVSHSSDDGDYLRAVQEGDYIIVPQKDCSLNKDHVTQSYNSSMPVRLIVGEDVMPLTELDGEGNVYVLVTAEFAEQIKQSGLTGYKFSPVVLDAEELKRTPNYTPPNFFELQFKGRKCFRPFSVVGAPNECPYCHKGPLICPECGHQDVFCPNCGKDYSVAPKNHKGGGDLRLLTAGWDNWRPAIIEVERWDGSDFIFGSDEVGLRSHVITKRALDWLLSVHATQFFAKPALANIEEISEEKAAMLTNAKDLNSLEI